MEQPHDLILKDNWLSKPPHEDAELMTIFMTALIAVASCLYFFNWLDAQSWIAATRSQVFDHHQYWRAWTTLFAHADIGHVFSNLFLFVPLSYFLFGYYGAWFFPSAGIFIGGLVNFEVLSSLPPDSTLVGISGVVYWMGAAWMTLFLIIERKQSLRRRVGKVLIITAALFFPQTFKPEVSYLSHFLGFITGVASALVYYMIMRKDFARAEVYIAQPREEDFDQDVITSPSESEVL